MSYSLGQPWGLRCSAALSCRIASSTCTDEAGGKVRQETAQNWSRGIHSGVCCADIPCGSTPCCCANRTITHCPCASPRWINSLLLCKPIRRSHISPAPLLPCLPVVAPVLTDASIAQRASPGHTVGRAGPCWPAPRGHHVVAGGECQCLLFLTRARHAHTSGPATANQHTHTPPLPCPAKPLLA